MTTEQNSGNMHVQLLDAQTQSEKRTAKDAYCD